jgi:hypothetical protein
MLAVGYILEPRPTNAVEDDDEYEDDWDTVIIFSN